jgi:capsular exopolysaccharide synthesis family protein
VVAPHTSLLSDAAAPATRAFNPEWLARLVVAPQPNPTVVEQFRGLAASLHRAQGAGSLKTVLVTSSAPSEGKTLTSLNLALTLSESYRRRVLLIDADLRRPSLRSIAQLPDGPGLSEGLKAPTAQKLSVVQLTRSLTLLPAGRPDPDPMSSLTSSRMHRVLEEAVAGFDWVVIDAPPIGPIADAGLLAAMVDAVLLVIRAGETSCGLVQNAIDMIGRDRIFGVVLNSVEEIAHNAYYRQYGGESGYQAAAV